MAVDGGRSLVGAVAARPSPRQGSRRRSSRAWVAIAAASSASAGSARGCGRRSRGRRPCAPPGCGGRPRGPGPRRSSSGVSAVSRATSSSRSPAVARPGFSSSRTSSSSRESSTRWPSRSRAIAPVSLELGRQRVAVGRLERRLDLRHQRAEALAEDAEVGAHLVAHEVGALRREADVLDVELVAHQVAARPLQPSEDLALVARHQRDGGERLAGLDLVRVARRAAERHDLLRRRPCAA